MESIANNIAALWIVGIMGVVLLAIVGFFLHHHYKATITFIDEVRVFNATTDQKIDGVVKDIIEIKTFQSGQSKWTNEIWKRLIKVETKLEIIK